MNKKSFHTPYIPSPDGELLSITSSPTCKSVVDGPASMSPFGEKTATWSNNLFGLSGSALASPDSALVGLDSALMCSGSAFACHDSALPDELAFAICNQHRQSMESRS